MAHLVQVGAAEARQHGDGQQLQIACRPAFDRRAHHRSHRVHGEEADTGARHLRHGPLHGFGNVVELQVEENVFAQPLQLAHEIHAGGGVEFHADFVEIDAVAKPRHQRARFRGRFHIQCDDNRVRFHIR